ncbi:MAG: hypothetical protein IKI05_01645 [Bacteroidaceae bacterium]|nr:hypothetical protein [Bacteroidaceae bacterium]
MRKASRKEVRQAIQEGIIFRKGPSEPTEKSNRVKTKAKKKSYITGAHGSASARKKAAIRQARSNRNKH